MRNTTFNGPTLPAEQHIQVTVMEKGINQKLKLLYLVRIFREQTDDNHKLTISDIIEKLNGYDVNADRKTLWCFSFSEASSC